MLRRIQVGLVAMSLAVLWSSGLSAKVLEKVAHGNTPVQSIDAITFAPDGVLLIGDGRGAQVFAVQTGDTTKKKRFESKIAGVQARLAEKLGAKPDGIEIVDLAVNPASGTAYIALRKQDDKTPLILTVDGDGKIDELSLESVDYARIALPAEGTSPVNKITDLAWAEDKLLVAGAANEEFASKIYVVNGPLANEAAGAVHSAETYHVSHHKWETKAPMSALIPYKEDGKLYVVGAFACTPIVKYPVEALSPGAKVKGISVIELGSGNRPLDMFSYEKDGREYVLTNTVRRKSLGRPSPYWTVRFERDLLGENESINEKAASHQNKFDDQSRLLAVDAYDGVMQMDQLDNSRALVLRADGKGGVDLEPLALP